MPQDDRISQLVHLAEAIREHNTVHARIAELIDRPALVGHVGEYIASAIFDIELNLSASAKGHDGFFRPPSPLAGRSVNIKWGTVFEGGMDVSPDAEVDDYLALTGPRATSMTSKGRTRPWLVESVFLFDLRELRAALIAAGVGIGVATSIRRSFWDAAMIYPEACNPRLVLSEEQRRLVALFGQPFGES
jgi:hypothetical protein